MLEKLIKNKSLNNKKRHALVLLSLFFILVAGSHLALAQSTTPPNSPNIGGYLSNGLAWLVAAVLAFIAYIITAVLGLMFTVLVSVLVQLATYTNFIGAVPVTMGWTIIRDICNMFFILILLIIAFATILRQESYSIKKTLPKLLIMAVLINFSKMIFGIIIDAGQVVMMTFANAINQGVNWFIVAFSVDKWYKLRDATGLKDSGMGDANQWNIVMAIIAGVIAAVIAIITIGVVVAVLVARIVMIWIYVMLSPLVFLGFAFPPIAKYTSQIWQDFIKQVVVGPVLIFFVWLALMIASASKGGIPADLHMSAPATEICAGAGAFFCGTQLQSFLIVVGVLMGGLMVAQQMGGAAASIAGKGLNWARKAASTPMLALAGAKKIGGFGIDKLSAGIGIDLNVFRGIDRIKKKMAENKATRENDIHAAAVEKASKGGFGHRLALISTGDMFWQNITGGKAAWKRMIMGPRLEAKYKKEVEELEKEKEGYLTPEEGERLDAEVRAKQLRINNIDREIGEKQKEKSQLGPSSTPEQEKKIDDEITALRNLKESLDKQVKKGMDELAVEKTQVTDEKMKEINDKIKSAKDNYFKYQLTEASTSKANLMAELERQQAGKIAHIDNAAELGMILKEAVRTGNKGLVYAVSKKMSKNGDYNEVLGAFSLGTGRKGMQDYAKEILQKQAGFSEDESYSLLADMGHIAKGIRHYGGFGTVKLDKFGKWQPTDEDTYNQMILNEMNKGDYRSFAATNRLGVGQYINGDHNPKNWRPLKAALVYMKNNYEQVQEALRRYGNANAAYHMIVHEDILRENKIEESLIKAMGQKGSPDEIGKLDLQIAGIKGMLNPDEIEEAGKKKK